jgi:hypothetical protein
MVSRVLLRPNNVDISADHPHANGADDSTAKQEIATAQLVDQEKKPHKSHDGLDDAKDTRHPADIALRDTDALEDSRAVVVDCVNARSILPEEEHASEEEAVQDRLASGNGLEGLPETDSNCCGLLLQGLIDGGHLFGDIDVGFVELADPAEVGYRLGAAALKEEPARRLADPEGADEEKTRGNDLDGERDDPLLVRGGHMHLDSVLVAGSAVCS